MAKWKISTAARAGKLPSFRLLLLWLALTVLAVVFIFFCRSQLNMSYQEDRIQERLDDYPRLSENYSADMNTLYSFWKQYQDQLLARQAVFFYTHETGFPTEAERLAQVARLMDVSEVRIISAAQEAAFQEQARTRELSSVTAPLEDGRLLAVSFPPDENYQWLSETEYLFLLTRLEAGLPGHMAVQHDGLLYIYPDDQSAEPLRQLLEGWISTGLLNQASLKEKASAEGTPVAVQSFRSPAVPGYPAGFFTMYAAAYADLDDFVISITPTRDLQQIGLKRTVSLSALTAAIFLLLCLTLWKTRLVSPESPQAPAPRPGRFSAAYQCRFLLAVVCLFLALSTIVIQMLSTVNQSAQSASASSGFLQEILSEEKANAESISRGIDQMSWQRVHAAARFLSGHPELAELDTLKALDELMDGAGLRICGLDGTVKLSDELFQANGQLDSLTEEGKKIYRAPLLDQSGHTTGFLDYILNQNNPGNPTALLRATNLRELLLDLHMLDTLEVLAVSKEDRKTIAAASRESWIGESVQEHGIAENLLYDGYEGLMYLDGENHYACVFALDSSLIVVGSKPVPASVFLRTILPLLAGLLLILLLLYHAALWETCRFQRLANEAGDAPDHLQPTPPLRFFRRGFMLSLFFLSCVLFMITNGNPTGLTYNIVRGVWMRGVNVVTMTTCFMAASAIVSFYTLLGFMLDRISGQLSPKGKTICQIVKSASHYLGTICMVLYSLSLLGVQTGTLIGGVGVTALAFTLGANSLIADVLAGFFIIFEGNIVVGDILLIGDFRGTVTEISIRTTKLRANSSGDVKIINNSQLKELINQSQANSTVSIILHVSPAIGIERGGELIRKALREAVQRHPEIIGEPRFYGVSRMPEWNVHTDSVSPFPVRVAFDCRAKDRMRLTFILNTELTPLACFLLNGEEPPEAPVTDSPE